MKIDDPKLLKQHLEELWDSVEKKDELAHNYIAAAIAGISAMLWLNLFFCAAAFVASKNRKNKNQLGNNDDNQRPS